jgi:hypothetical protein
MNRDNKIISKSSSWYWLFLPFVTSTLLSYSEGVWTNWFWIICPFVAFYPFLCFGVQFVRFYEDSMVIIRPFNLLHIKTVITYNKIERISDVIQGRSTVILSPYDLHVYVKDKKRPIGIPMPSPRQNREQFMKLIETKGICAEWGIYG